jgi:hypothetical protein
MNTDQWASRNASATMLKLQSGLRMIDERHGMAADFPWVCRFLGAFDRSDEAVLNKLHSFVDGSIAEEFTKANVPGMGFDDAWASVAVRDMVAAFFQSIAPSSILDLLAQYARPLPLGVPRILIASGAVANVVAEGYPKAVTRLSIAPQDGNLQKAAGIMVMSKELSLAVGEKAQQLFAAELQSAIVRAFNVAAIDQLQVTGVATTGTALGDLKAGIEASAASANYVVATSKDIAMELAFESNGRMGPGGGQFLPGVHVVPVEVDSNTSRITVIPADRVALADSGFVVRNASQADVQMSDSPTSPGAMTNLWQTGNHALLFERSFRLTQADNAIAVG